MNLCRLFYYGGFMVTTVRREKRFEAKVLQLRCRPACAKTAEGRGEKQLGQVRTGAVGASKRPGVDFTPPAQRADCEREA